MGFLSFLAKLGGKKKQPDAELVKKKQPGAEIKKKTKHVRLADTRYLIFVIMNLIRS